MCSESAGGISALSFFRYQEMKTLRNFIVQLTIMSVCGCSPMGDNGNSSQGTDSIHTLQFLNFPSGSENMLMQSQPSLLNPERIIVGTWSLEDVRFEPELPEGSTIDIDYGSQIAFENDHIWHNPEGTVSGIWQIAGKELLMTTLNPTHEQSDFVLEEICQNSFTRSCPFFSFRMRQYYVRVWPGK